MSIWLGRRDEDGKRRIYFAEIPFQLVLAACLLLVFMVAPRYSMDPGQILIDSLVMLSVGFLLYLASKISLFARGIWTSWGPGPMTRPFKVLYVLGIGLMVVGGLLMALGSLIGP